MITLGSAGQEFFADWFAKQFVRRQIELMWYQILYDRLAAAKRRYHA